MTPHSEALLLLFSFSLCGSLYAVSLNRNEKAWASTDPEPASSSLWTFLPRHMDTTTPTILSLSPNALQSEKSSRDLEVDPLVEQNPYVTMENRGLSRLPDTRTPLIKYLTSPKTEIPLDIQNDEEGSETEASDWPNFSKQGNTDRSLKSYALVTLQPFPSQTSTESKTPNDWNTETNTPQTHAETRFHTYQTLWKSFSATQKPYARGTLDGTTLPRGLIDYMWPSEETKDLTDAPTGNPINDTSKPTHYVTTELDSV